ncbi:hypothetical protein IFM89_017161 [Coptis chinensis]|uniref:Trichome birefringence-like N-terminal domain-containing protein n=1 Tax=Coptis chinensis TaxID=261450 RepID=A0A835LUI1_9MAGN|nr:hypothetical protein IFM89_017161 [Coptis chinensis]
MKSSSSALASLEPLHYHHKRERYVNKERLGLFLLWLLGATTVFSLFILYAPRPFKFSPRQELNARKVYIKPKHDYENCDLFNGRWIPDLSGPLYTNWTCSTIPDSKKCGKHGRKDVDYLNWRWKPYECELQKFDAKNFLSIIQGKTIAFIGDSVARNQMESLLCLLSQEQTPIDIYKGSNDRFRTWYFPSHDFTIKVLWTTFFVIAEERIINGTYTGVYDMHLDRLDKKWAEKLPGVDYAIISNGHWFFRPIYLYERGSVIGCVYCDAENISNVSPGFALQKAFRRALKYINACKECRGLYIVRTFSPAHFKDGSWNTGGRCNRTSPFTENQIHLGGTEWEFRTIQAKEIERAKKKGEKTGKRFEALDVTKAMLMRPDGHPDLHWNNEFMRGYSDCVHWCLPGPIDAWNDLLTTVLMKEDNLSVHN